LLVIGRQVCSPIAALRGNEIPGVARQKFKSRTHEGDDGWEPAEIHEIVVDLRVRCRRWKTIDSGPDMSSLDR
jgi:hypothetical protein